MAAAGCDESRPRVQSRPTTSPAPEPTVRGRFVVIEAVGPVRERLETAIDDLKAVDMWDRLTEHLYRVELDSRHGTANVPEDGHLADAYFTGIVVGGGGGEAGGEVCDVMFFPSAITADLARWRSYYAQGAIADPAPTLRQFYGSLLAHELAHCRRGPRGESVAQAWERRALDALRTL